MLEKNISTKLAVFPKYYYVLITKMSQKASRVYDAACEGGYEITPASLGVAIRAAILECTDEQGHLNLPELYNLTGDLYTSRLNYPDYV